MVKTELDQFRDSLNLPGIENQLEGLSTKIAAQKTSLEGKIAAQATSLEGKLATQTTALRTLQTVVKEIDTRTTSLENKPRFAAEKRLGSFLSRGDITDFTELVDVGDFFNPTTGRLSINEDSLEGKYLFYVSAFKSGIRGKVGMIEVYKNQEVVHRIYESDGGNYLMMNSVFTLHLQKGDEVRLYNVYEGSIDVDGGFPFTFTGYKI